MNTLRSEEHLTASLIVNPAIAPGAQESPMQSAKPVSPGGRGVASALPTPHSHPSVLRLRASHRSLDEDPDCNTCRCHML